MVVCALGCTIDPPEFSLLQPNLTSSFSETASKISMFIEVIFFSQIRMFRMTMLKNFPKI